jgi:hypothetical protein
VSLRDIAAGGVAAARSASVSSLKYGNCKHLFADGRSCGRYASSCAMSACRSLDDSESVALYFSDANSLRINPLCRPLEEDEEEEEE